jgi:ATP-dependent Zn protease
MQALFGSNGLGLTSRPAEKDLNWLYDQGKAKNIESAVFQGDTINVKLNDSMANGEKRAFIRINGENNQLATNIYDRLQKLDVKVKWEPPPPINMVFQALSFIALPLMLFGLIYFLMIRPAQMGGNQAMSFGRRTKKRCRRQLQYGRWVHGPMRSINTQRCSNMYGGSTKSPHLERPC